MEGKKDKSKFEVDIKKFAEHLESKWGRARPCPMCSETHWSLDKTIWEIKEYQEGGIGEPYKYMPVAAAICTNCGNTVLVNVFSAGLGENLEQDGNEEENGKEEESK